MPISVSLASSEIPSTFALARTGLIGVLRCTRCGGDHGQPAANSGQQHSMSGSAPAGGVKRGIEGVRACGTRRLVARRYSDFGDRMRRLANLIAGKAPLLATPGSVADVEYQEHLREAMHRLVPFLNEQVREALAGRLIAEHEQ
jgi:hypothetical protein